MSSATHACSQQQSTLIMSRGPSVALGAFLMTIALTACIGPVKPVPTQQSQEVPPPPTETADASKPVEAAPSNTPPPPPATFPVPLPLIGMGQPTAPQEEEEIPGKEVIPVVEAKPVVVVASRESYNVQNTTTATKTDTPIMETPVSIQVVPQQVLQDQQVVRTDQITRNVSGVYLQTGAGGAANNFQLRGFPGDYTYRDGFRYGLGDSAMPYRDMANIEQIEVLKGPASILYGRIEPGGIVNLVTKKPLDYAYHALEQQVGSYNFYRTTVDATGPLMANNKLGYRVNMAYENSGSFRDYIHNDRFLIAPVLRWNLSEKTLVNVELQYSHTLAGIDQGIFALGDRVAPLPRNRNLVGPNDGFPTDEYFSGVNWSHAFNDHWTLNQRFNTNISNSPTFNSLYLNGPDPNNCTLQQCPLTRGVLSQYLNRQTYFTTTYLTGKLDTWDLKHTLMLGGDFYNSHLFFRQDFQSTLNDPSNPNNPFNQPFDAFQPIPNGPSPNTQTAPDFFTPQNYSTGWYGFYLQDQVQLPQNLYVLAGFRYDNAYAKSSFQSFSTTANAVNIFGPNSSSASSMREDAIKPRFGLLWRPLEQLSVFGDYVENFGVTNGRTADGTPLPPQTAQQWEVGVKTELFDKRLTGTLSWFNLTKQNLFFADPNPLRAAAGFGSAIGEAKSQGLELDIAGEPLPGLKLIANYAYTDAMIRKDLESSTDAQGNPVVVSNAGHRLPGIPRQGASLWGTYELLKGDWRGLKIGGGVLIRSQQQGDAENDFQLPGYATVSLMAGYERKVGGTKIKLQFNVDNLLDQSYYIPSNFRTNIYPGTPQTFLGMIKMELW